MVDASLETAADFRALFTVSVVQAARGDGCEAHGVKVTRWPRAGRRVLAVRGEVLQDRFDAAVVLAGVQAKLGEDVGDVLGHRGGRKDELGGDVLVGLAAGH